MYHNPTALSDQIAEYDYADEAALAMDDFAPGWEEREEYGVRFLSEGDFALDSPDSDAVSEDDWQAFLEMSYVDPAERGW